MEGDTQRQPRWTDSIAVGDKIYVEEVKGKMGHKAIGRKVVENQDSFVLKETEYAYQRISDRAIRARPEDNTFYWQMGPEYNPDSDLS